MAAAIQTVVLPSTALGAQPWWRALHDTINAAYQNKNTMVFPPSWTRLHEDPDVGAERLAQELGPNGYLAVLLLEDQHPVACGGVLPFRGTNWIQHVQSADKSGETFRAKPEKSVPSSAAASQTSDAIEEWEVNCFCVRVDHRGRGLSNRLLDILIDFVASRGAKRLFSNYVIEETGQFWTKLDFEPIPDAGGILHKGYTHTVGMEGLRSDIHFAMGVRNI